MAKSSVTMEQGGGSKRDTALSTRSNADQGQSSDKLQPFKARTEQLGAFLHDVRAEMKKVSTPTREQVQSTTIVVLVTVFVFALYFWLVDRALTYSLDKFIYRFTHHT